MRLVNHRCIARGEMLVDVAMHRPQLEASLDVADMIGIVAAYIARGHYPCDIEKNLTPVMGPELALRASKTFELFESANGNGLWSQGAAMDDVALTSPKLRSYYPLFATENGGVIAHAPT